MHRLYRSTQDRMLTGLCGGIAQEFGVNPTLLRILFLVAIPLTSGAMLPLYFIASLVIPKDPTPPYYPYDPDMYGRDPYRDPYRPDNAYDREMRDSRFPGPHDPRSPRPLGPEREFARPFPPQHRPNAPHADLKKRDVPDSGLDAMMEDIEKKALQKEVEELKQKLSKYEDEKGDL